MFFRNGIFFRRPSTWNIDSREVLHFLRYCICARTNAQSAEAVAGEFAMRIFSRILAGLAFILCVCSGAFAQQYDFSVRPGAQIIPLLKGSYGLSGEVQSTVVAPNLKSECKAGRFLISMDTVRPPQSGTVIGRDLNGPASPDIKSTFSGDPDSTHELFGTNDDDIITMPNGDILLIWGVHIDPNVSPLPGWFNHTYANDGKFGPGARRGTVVYRSTDCGNSFQYMSRIDPAQLGDGACGNPQPAAPAPPDKPTRPGEKPQPPPKAGQPYVNGGSDGQLARTQNGVVYLTMDCVGRLQDKSKPGWVISDNYVARTYALRSTNEGAKFSDLGYLPGLGAGGWRAGVVPLSTGDIAFGVENFLMFGRKKPNGTYSFSGTRTQTSTPFDWTDIDSNPVFADINGKFNGDTPDPRQMANTLITRVPGGDDVMLAYPAAVNDGNGMSLDGYEIYFYDPSTGQFGQANPVFPVVHAANHFLMHMVAIDPGSGPVLLYWDDVDGNARTATMRGRFIYGNGSYSSDFAVATLNAANTPYSFPMAHAWYGDYHTAGGFASAESSGGGGVNSHPVADYFPVWVQSGGLALFSHVSVGLLPLQKGTQLFVGTQPNCNAGVVTTNPNHMNCTTKPIGFSVDGAGATPAGNFAAVFVGNQPNVNDGVASTNPHHLNGSTAPIGFLSKIPTEGGTKLFVGNVQNCNAGVLTTNTNHLNCATSFVGYTLPQQ
jgi:hypothetical protein